MLSLSMTISGQGIIGLEECREAALKRSDIEGYLSVDYQFIKAKGRYLFSEKLPTAFAFGYFTTQSDVPDPNSALEFGFDFTPMSHQTYRTGLMVKQLLYDGGEVKSKISLLDVELSKRKSEIYRQQLALEEQVDELFFNSIALDREMEMVERYLSLLDEKVEELHSLFEEGKLLVTELIKGEVAREKVAIKLETTKEKVRQARAALSIITGIEIGEEQQLLLPDISLIEKVFEDPFHREVELANEGLKGVEKLAKAKVMPTLEVFGVVGVAKPGLDFFDNSPRRYGVAGFSLTVPISGWRDYNRYRASVAQQQKSLALIERSGELERDLKVDFYSREVERVTDEIRRELELAKKEGELVDRYEELFSVGEVSFSDYSTALNEKLSSDIKIELMKLQLMKIKIDRGRVVTEIDLDRVEWNETQ